LRGVRVDGSPVVKRWLRDELFFVVLIVLNVLGVVGFVIGALAVWLEWV
jgi:hypothetical protein